MKKKVLIIISISILVILTLLLGYIIYVRVSLKDFYKNARKEFKIPSNGFVVQGIDYDGDRIYLTGYQSNNRKASNIYVIENNEYKKINLYNEDKSIYNGHAGGITVHGDYIYIAGDTNYLLVYSKKDIDNASNNDSVYAIGKFSTKDGSDELRISFTTRNDNVVVLGEFYRSNNYKTDISHHIDDNKAIAVTYNFNDEYEFGIDPNPISIYSLPDLVQGMAFDNDNLYLSTSYAISFSKIYKYDLNKIDKESISLFDRELPLYKLDDNSLISTTQIPPMSEEIIIKDGRLYIISESASNKYIFGNLIGGRYCYSLDISK